MEAQFDKAANAVMQFEAYVARVLKDAILLGPEDDRFAWVDLTADTKVNLHLGKDLKRKKTKTINVNFFSSVRFVLTGLVSYLYVFGELVIDKETEGSEISDDIKLEDDLNRLTVAGVVAPTNPTCTAKQTNNLIKLVLHCDTQCVCDQFE